MSELVFGKYEIIRRLAIGGMGEIFLARQVGVAGFDRLMILKSLLPDLAKNPESVEQFLDEARVAATLNHPNIVAIYEVGLWQGVYFIAMEYIRGVAVSDLIMRAHRTSVEFPHSIAALIARDSAIGLHHAHQASDTQGNRLNIIHRDVSPQNIMIRADGVTKVVDFGIAKAANRSTRTATGQVKGKLGYMAPEQLSGSPVEPRSDQFSLGIVLWEMCTRRRLFHESSPGATMTKILAGNVPAVATVVEGFPSSLDAILARMLQLDPEKRFATCRDCADALQDFLNTHSREVGTNEVTGFVEAVAGEEIDEKTRDLTPSRPDFLIALNRNPEAETTLLPAPVPTRGRPIRFAVPILLLAGLAVLGAIAIRPAPVRETVAPVPVAEPRLEASERAPLLDLRTEPSGAIVYRDGEVIGRTPFKTRKLPADVDHQLLVSLEGFDSERLTVRFRSGEEVLKRIELARTQKSRAASAPRRPTPASQPRRRPPAAEQSGPGYLTLATKPWTRVEIEGRPFGSTPLYRAPIASGRYRIRLVNEAADIDEVRVVVVKSGEIRKLSFDLRK